MAVTFLRPMTQTGPIPSSPISDPMGSQTGEVSDEDALKGAAHTKIDGFSATDIPKNGPSSGSTVQLGNLIQGKHAIELVDAIIPSLFVVLLYKQGIQVKKSEMQLTEKEKNILAPIVEACMNTINLNFASPWQTLGISVLFIYGSKLIEHGGVKWIDKKISATKSPAELTKDAEKKSADRRDAKQAAQDVKNSVAPSSEPVPQNQWTQTDLERVEKKRKKGPKEAAEYLNANWKKWGCVLPEKYK